MQTKPTLTYIHKRALIGLVLLLFSSGFDTSLTTAQDRKAYDIHEIEAAFIFNFIDFINWPHNNHSSSDTLIIGILGDDKFGRAFDPIEGRRALGRTLIVRRSQNLSSLMGSWILFISNSEARNLNDILEALQERPVLTVSDIDRFTQAGGMIQFYTADVGGETKVRFDINKENADRAGLKISFRLLSLARPKP